VKAVLYARVSTQRQGSDEHFSLPVQRQLFATRCASHSYEPAGEFIDEESGRSVTRKGYQALLEGARRGDFDVVVVRAIDRLGRDADELTVRVAELRQAGVRVDAIHTIVPDAGTDPSTVFLLRAVEAFLAQKESEQISARVKGTMAASARAGNWQGGPAPYGYRIEGKRLVVHEVEAEVVRGIFRAYVEDDRSIIQISRDLNLRDVPSRHRKPWSITTVAQILRRATYTGAGSWAGEAGWTVPAIIERGTYEAARARAERKRTLPAGRTQTSAYLLSGLVYCARCGGRMLGHKSSPRGVESRGYVCSRHRKDGGCSLNYCGADQLEAAVLADLALWFGDWAQRQQRTQTEIGRLEASRAEIEKRIAAMPALFLKRLEDYDRGTFTEAQFRLANERDTAEQARLEAERDRLADDIARARLAVFPPPASDLAFTETFGALTMPQQKALLQRVVERIDCDAGREPAIRLVS
jgi:site-specific DNA recombinase